MQTKGIALSVVVDGHDETGVTAREYVAPDGDVYIEGRDGRPYTIVVENRNPHRVCVVLSVDGLSVMDGRRAGSRSRGYVVDPHSTLRVPGWLRDDRKVARFEFADMRGGSDPSYVALMGGDLEHKGVIGATVFEEMRRPVPRRPSKSAFEGFAGLSASSSMRSSATLSCSSARTPLSLRSSSHEDTAFRSEAEEQMGTGYGREQDFATRACRDFVRGAELTRLSLFYDQERGLKRRGIDVRRPVSRKPNPFPADMDGCPAPSGWKAG